MGQPTVSASVPIPMTSTTLRTSILLLTLAGAAQAQVRREVPAPGVPAEPVAEETYALDVAFEVGTGQRRERRVVPGEIVELGVGSKADHAPLYADSPVLARLTSDADGMVRTTLQIPKRWEGNYDARVWARIETPGRKRLMVQRYAYPRTEHALIRMITFGGGTLLGTVIDAEGRPVPDADVQLFSEQDGAFERVSAGSEGPDSRGRFALNYHRPGTYVLQARCTGLGSGVVRGLELPGQQDSFEIVLRPGVRPEGRVVDPAGHPVPGLQLTAVPESGCASPADVLAHELQGGLALDRARTDGDGVFAFTALAPGSYALHQAFGPDVQLTARVQLDRLGPGIGVLSAPSTERLDVVAAAYRMEVEVVDAQGHSVAPGEALLVHRATDPHWDLHPIELGDRRVYVVEPGLEYLVSWTRSDAPHFEQRVQVVPGQHRTPVRIQLPPPQEPAELQVRLLDRRTTAPIEGEYWQHLEIIVRGEVGDRMVAGTVVPGVATPAFELAPSWTTELPPGRYRVEVGSAATFECVVPTPFPRNLYPRAFAELELLPGESRELTLQLAAGAHLDFEPVEPRGRFAREVYDELMPNNVIPLDFDERAERRFGAARVSLLSASGARVEVGSFEVPYAGGASFDGYPWIVPGWSARGLSAVPAGDWTLRIERDGETLLEQPVTIRAGEVTTVRW